jgi:hypothetical protein
MSQKKDKKARRLFRTVFRNRIEEVAEKNARMIKPKPKWIPMFLWIRMLKIFIRVK